MKALKWIGIVIGALFFLTVVGGVVLYFALKPYLSSDSFRQLVEAEVSKKLQVETHLEPLQWSGLSLFVNSAKTTGTSKVTIKSLDLQQLRISIALRPLLHRVARIDSIEIQSLAVEFQVPEPQPESPTKTEEAPAPPPSWIQSIAPQKIEIGEIDLRQGSLRWPSGENSFGELTQFKLLATVDGNDFNLQFRDGNLNIPQLPPLTLKTLKGRVHQETLFITNATFDYEKQGTFNIDGEIGIGTPSSAHLNFEVNSVPIAPFLPGDWRARLVGNLNGKLKLIQDEKTNGFPQVTGNVELNQGKIEALPLFNKLAEITQTERWKSVSLDRAKTYLNWTPQKTVLEQIDFESKNLLLLQGNFQVEGQAIASSLTVGTDPSLLKPLPGILDQVFNQPMGNYATTPVQISGTKDDLKEDLTERILVAAATGLLQKIPGSVGEKIQNVTDEIQKKVPGLLDIFKKQ